ncbi:MAG: DUF2062 domain-containing protein [Sphingopyxis sp.]|nr:DUF2062 domain-containing protein [Sphingopyxis sp.]
MAGFFDWVRRNSPGREELLESRLLKPFAHRIAHSELWHFTRRSVPRGVALGLFVGIFLLIPGVQIIGVAMLALPCRANIPIGAAMTFLSNPFTTPFILASSAWVGSYVFGLHADISTFYALIASGAGVSEWAAWFFSDAAPATLAGLFIISVISAAVGYVLASVLWAQWLRQKWRARRRRRRAINDANG